MIGGFYDGTDGEELSEDQRLVLANLDDDLAGGGFDSVLDTIAATRLVYQQGLEVFRAFGQTEGAAKLEEALANLDAAEDSIVHLRVEHPEVEGLYEAERQRMLTEGS